MRFFFLLFLLSWLAGLALGVSGASLHLFFFCLVLQIILIYLSATKTPHQAACLLLLLLGFLYGHSVASINPSLCDMKSSATGRVINMPDVRPNALRLRVALDNCTVLVSVSPFLDIKAGDTIALSGGRIQTLSQVSDFSAGYGEYLKRQGISGTWQYPDVAVINSGAASPWRHLIRLPKLHDGLRLRIQKLFTEPDASMVTAFLLGEAGTLPARLTDQFRATGVSHVLAISGSNIALLAAIAYALLSLFPLPPWPRTILITVLLWLYIIFINAPLSAVRAAYFFSLALVFLRLHHLVSLPTALFLTCAVTMTANPLVLFDIGWQLSVAAVAGIFMIIFLIKPYQHRLALPWFAAFTRGLINLFLLSLGAWLATMPLVAASFGTISVVSLLANLLVVPTISFYIIVSIIALAFSFLPVISLLLSYLLRLIINWLDYITAALSAWPGALLENVPFPPWLVFVYYLGLAALAIIIVRWQGRSWREVWE